AINTRFQQVETAFGMLPALATFGLELAPLVTAGGTANALTITSAGEAVEAYTAGQRVHFKAAAANTGAVSLNVDGLGVKSLKRANGTATEADDLQPGCVYQAVYDGSDFRLAA